MTTARRPPARFPASLPAAASPVSAPAPASAAGALLRPQRPLQQAADHAARSRAPSGLGLDSAQVRQRMVQRLREGGVRCEPVLAAFAAVERHRFVDTALATQAYEDTALPIGLGQTISKPSVVARMLALLFEGPGTAARGHLGRVLEVGTGCGYQAALLAHLARTVVSIERLRPLHDKARAQVSALRLPVAPWLLYGDGRLGHGPRAPYDNIIAAAGGEELPAAWLDQLAAGGRLVAPVIDAARGGQGLLVVDRDANGGLQRRWLDAVHFVPLKSGTE